MPEVIYPEVGYGLAVALDEGDGSENYAVLTESADGSPVTLTAMGLSDNISIRLVPKGTGTVDINPASFGTSITVGANLDNYTTISGAAAGSPVLYQAFGSDTDVVIRLLPKGDQYVWAPKLSLSANAPGITDLFRKLNISASGTYASGNALVRIGGNFTATSLGAAQQGVMQVISADADTMNFADTSDGATLIYNGAVLRNGWNGGRTLSTDLLFVGRASNPGEDNGTSGASSYLVSGASFVRAYSGMGGTPGATKGNLFGRNDSVEAFNGTGAHLNSVFGNETDLGVGSEVRVMWKGAYKAVLWNTDAQRGIQQDFAYSIGMQADDLTVTSTAPGFGVGYAIGGVEGWWPLTETSAVMRGIAGAGIANGPSFSIGIGIDFSNLTRIRESAFKSPFFRVSGSGTLGALVTGGVALQTRSAITAKTAVVASVDVIYGGLYSSATIPLTAETPSGGTPATVTVAALALLSGNSIPANGTGYAVGDTFSVDTGTGVVTAEATFTGSIADNVLTVTAVGAGTIVNNSFVLGTNVIANTKIIAFLTGAGGTGTYQVDTSQVLASTALSCNGNPRGVVTGVTGGLVTRFRITHPGRFTTAPSSPLATTATSGAGTGFTFTPLYTMLAVTVGGGGTNYSGTLPPLISIGSASQLSEATFAVSMTETQAPLLLNAGSSTQVDSLTVNASGPTLRSGTGAASGTQPKGSIWMRTDGGVGTTMYVSQGGGTWNAIAGV